MSKDKKNDQKKNIDSTPASAANREATDAAIANHRQAAAHHTEAAKHNLQAAKHYEDGKFNKAANSAFLASGHHAIAGEFISDDAKHHAQILKQQNFRS